ncbi:MAG: 50S ribosomal protein L17 [Candidatus Niyogibacteria bacterium CG10_big_fil_rev_8_21_14_0_10_42_19]|uniref:50S ribosomal protein L17 n=1 Tax=Candidatus Niyogibacteria bacterium CG10_big_fil_rev_8_21_14_0_10_42_19 TaxID=1974725 RepID=A0A2H0THB1_9BACT|nr:MAG: 50S ribosomal protein L17 [Candidatus Niyogibacteria bacterium CG10_big_fil_rev_8_21_14_0_10_42_19]
MRHNNKNKILKRKRNPRRSLLRGLMNSIIIYGEIETTLAKARFLKPGIERLISVSRVSSLENRRKTARVVSKPAVKKLFDILGPRYKDRKGGYTRIIKLSPRKSDNSETALIKFV